jgi:hypothetical protein
MHLFIFRFHAESCGKETSPILNYVLAGNLVVSVYLPVLAVAKLRTVTPCAVDRRIHKTGSLLLPTCHHSLMTRPTACCTRLGPTAACTRCSGFHNFAVDAARA